MGRLSTGETRSSGLSDKALPVGVGRAFFHRAAGGGQQGPAGCPSFGYPVISAPATSLIPTAHLDLTTLGFGDLGLAWTCFLSVLTESLTTSQSRGAPSGAAACGSSFAARLRIIDSMSLRAFFRAGTQS